jgi:beta-lactamase regulating signal transducer with metallopeptidase domain
MDFITQLFPEEIRYALGWTVLHSLWQGFVVALLLAAFLIGWQKKSARQRYFAANVALSSMLLIAVITFFSTLNEIRTANLAPHFVGSDSEAPAVYFIEENASSLIGYFNRHMPLIVAAWLMGMVFFALKMMGGLLYIQRLKHRHNSPMSACWQERLGALAGELGMEKTVRLAESVLVKVPMVLGWLKPVILMPLGAVNNLTTQQVEAILAHELAHVYRYDYLLNLMQSIIEILFYFNPAAWWISGIVRSERENCCDDIAVQLCGNSLTYAKALVSLQEMHHAAPAFAMPFSQKKHRLFYRIQRILQPSQNKSNMMEKMTATAMLLAAVLLLSVQANSPFANLLAHDEVRLSTFPEPASLFMPTDTIPKNRQGKTYLHRKEDGEEIQVILDNGKITHLEINGEEIPESDYGKYEQKVEELLASLPEPPAPPAPPHFSEPPAPPAAPEAPAPPSPSGTRKIVTKKNGKGKTTFIIETSPGEEPVKIVVKEGKKGSIIINGQEIKGMKKGDQTVILERNKGDASYFFRNKDGDEDGYAFVMPEIPELRLEQGQFDFAFPDTDHLMEGKLKGLLDKELKGELNSDLLRWNEEFRERFRDGNLGEEWLNEQRLLENSHPHILELNKLAEEHARMLEQHHNLSKEKLELLQQRQQEVLERAMQREEAARELYEKRRQEQMRKSKKLINYREPD